MKQRSKRRCLLRGGDAVTAAHCLGRKLQRPTTKGITRSLWIFAMLAVRIVAACPNHNTTAYDYFETSRLTTSVLTDSCGLVTQFTPVSLDPFYPPPQSWLPTEPFPSTTSIRLRSLWSCLLPRRVDSCPRCHPDRRAGRRYTSHSQSHLVFLSVHRQVRNSRTEKERQAADRAPNHRNQL